MKTYYIVKTALFATEQIGNEIFPSSDIDDRTIKEHYFNSYAKALKYANSIKENGDKEWLAFVEIAKAEMVKKIK